MPLRHQNVAGVRAWAAVNNANSYETICVAAGSYTDNVNITTPHLTLRGAGADVVTVTANSSLDHVFAVTKNYVNITGFTATGATDNVAGIYLYQVDHCNIRARTDLHRMRLLDSERNCKNGFDRCYLNPSSSLRRVCVRSYVGFFEKS